MNPLFELFYDDIDWPEVYNDAVWTKNGEELSYNLAGSVEDLENGDGDTYGGQILGIGVKKEGYVLYTVDSGCGYDYQVILKLANKVEL